MISYHAVKSIGHRRRRFGIGGQHGPDEYADTTTIEPYYQALTEFLSDPRINEDPAPAHGPHSHRPQRPDRLRQQPAAPQACARPPAPPSASLRHVTLASHQPAYR